MSKRGNAMQARNAAKYQYQRMRMPIVGIPIPPDRPSLGKTYWCSSVNQTWTILQKPLNTKDMTDKKMAYKFKIGDRVQINEQGRRDYDWPDGKEGTIVHQGSEYGVHFDDPFDGCHDLGGKCPPGEGYFIDSQYLELLSKQNVDFDTVVMADEKRKQIKEALQQVHKQELIFEKWNFKTTVEKGRGVSMLFYGPPGTGKTLTAQAIADQLGYKLIIKTTADIQSSEPGQAERNIREIFKKAKKNTVLLFDECDPLIYDRTHVGAIMAAHVNELLSSLEKFEGITIFTTNRCETLDEAVNRRLALKLEFELPSQEQRAEIWERMFPAEAPLDKDVDFLALAEIPLAGGHIKNAVLRAARMAAFDEAVPDDEKTITQKHLKRALYEEGKSMLQFQEMKKNFNVPRPMGPGGMRMTEKSSIEVARMSNIVKEMEQEDAES